MRAYVRLRGPDGAAWELLPGDIIGRTWCAALLLDDPRVSEAHAMVSLRDGELKLLSLRGAFALDGKPLRELCLEPGQEIQLARGLHLVVEVVRLPDTVLGLKAPGLPPQPVPAVASLVLDGGGLRVVSRYVEGAAARLWSRGDGWRLQLADGIPTPVDPGVRFEAGGLPVELVALPLRTAGQAATRGADGVQAPLHIVASFDTVHVYRSGVPLVSLSGVLARLVSELVAVGGPLVWTALGAELWPDEPEASLVRARLDTALSRLRRKLRAGRVRTDLVRTDGAGQVELLLYAHDTVEDRT